MPFTLAQLSDPHLVADPAGAPLGCPVREALDAVVKAAAQDAPGAALVTGDLSQDGTPASYASVSHCEDKF